ncbi:anaphase-promoting complex protein [Apiospora arundinis]
MHLDHGLKNTFTKQASTDDMPMSAGAVQTQTDNIITTSIATMSDAVKPFRFMDLPIELQLDILERTSLIAPYSQVHWKPKGFYWAGGMTRGRRHLAYPSDLFLVSRAFRDLAIQVFFKNNGIILTKAPQLSLGLDPSSRFFLEIVPSRSLGFIKSLCLKVKMNSHTWPNVVTNISTHLTSLRTLTIVGKFDHDNTVYNFSNKATIDQVRALVLQRLWPITDLGASIQQLIAHLHSGSGNWHAGRTPYTEPTYFFEKKETTDCESVQNYIDNTSNGVIRDIDGGLFVEGIIRTSLVEELIDDRF